MKSLVIEGCRLFHATEGAPRSSVLVKGGSIAEIGRVQDRPDAAEVLDAEGRILAPGFIDVHIQGAGGAGILDGSPEALAAIAKTCARFGTTGYLATTVFKPGEPNSHLAVAASNVQRNLGGAVLLGIHLEGPFISAEKRGMIQLDCICPPDDRVLERINDLTRGHLTMMTLAPELPGALGLVRSLVRQNTIASLGHTSATWQETRAGLAAGMNHVTHLFNAMPSLHHRRPGPLAAIFSDSTVTAQIIPDGVHIHPAVLGLAFGLLGPERVVCITDGMQAMGLPDGNYVYDGLDYETCAGTARYKDGTLIGTAMGLSGLVQRLRTLTGCSLEAAIRTVTENPARILGLDKEKGSLDVGKDADLVLLNEDLSVYATLVAGEIVFLEDRRVGP